jgi:hypothetical protein
LRKRALASSQTELETLKRLLLNDELKQLEKLESAIRELQFKSEDKESIIEKLTPLFDEILWQNFQTKEKKTIEILGRYLAQIIVQSSQENLEALSSSLQEVISPSIAKEIEENQDKMVDILYPIIGGMISRYVTQSIRELMDSINHKIEDGLSIERYKRKMKAKVTGVSESELLLEESSIAPIVSLFVIHKESGLLIAEATQESQAIDDPHMVASMASAIKDFINDWMQTHDTTQQSEVQLVSYGHATLYIEGAGSVYIIAFLEREPDAQQRLEINHFFASVVKGYNGFFQQFEGDDSAVEIEEIQEKLQHFLNLQEPHSKAKPLKEKQTKPLYWVFGVLLVIVLSFLVNFLYNHYRTYQLQEALLGEIPTAIHVEVEGHRVALYGEVKTPQEYRDILKFVEEEGYKVESHIDVPMGLLLEKERLFKTHLHQEHQKIAQLNRRFDRMNHEFQRVIQYNKISTFHLKEVEKLASVESYILEKLKKRFADYLSLDKDGALEFRNKHLFQIGNAIPNQEALVVLENRFKEYLHLLFDDPSIAPYIGAIVIEGYTDSSGSQKLNQRLSSQRAEYIRLYLADLDLVKSYHLEDRLYAKGLGSRHLVFVDGVEDKEASRRIKIKYQINLRKLVDAIKKQADG